MLLKDLIDELQKLYEEEKHHIFIMGEPEIMIDTFKKVKGSGKYIYSGFDKDIKIERSTDGVYLILNRFSKED